MSQNLRQNLAKLKIKQNSKSFYAQYTSVEIKDKFIDKIASKLAEGVEIVLLNGQGLSDKDFLDCAKKTKQLCEMFQATFIVESRADIAYLSSADGVNLEQDSLDIHSVREIVGEDILIGIYSSTKESALCAVKDGADYISVCQISSTPTEPVFPTGLEYAKWVSENTPFPVLIRGHNK